MINTIKTPKTAGYSLDFKGKEYFFDRLEPYHNYLQEMIALYRQKKIKFEDFPRLDKVGVLNLFLVEFNGRKLEELLVEDERELVASY